MAYGNPAGVVVAAVVVVVVVVVVVRLEQIE